MFVVVIVTSHADYSFHLCNTFHKQDVLPHVLLSDLMCLFCLSSQ